MPGVGYTSGVQESNRLVTGNVFAKLSLTLGEVKDLGDVPIKTSRRQ
jgi:hypothetical protein